LIRVTNFKNRKDKMKMQVRVLKNSIELGKEAAMFSGMGKGKHE